MSQQLTISSLFSVLALAGLCVMASARDLAESDDTGFNPAGPVQAELASGLHEG